MKKKLKYSFLCGSFLLGLAVMWSQDELSCRVSPDWVTAREMQKIEKLIVKHIEQTGQLPESLDVLPLSSLNEFAPLHIEPITYVNNSNQTITLSAQLKGFRMTRGQRCVISRTINPFEILKHERQKVYQRDHS